MQYIKNRAIFFLSLIALYYACVLALSFICDLLFSRILSNEVARHGGSGIAGFIIGFVSNGKLARTALSTGKHVIATVVFNIIGTSVYILAMWMGNTPPSEFRTLNFGMLLLVDVFVAYTTYALMLAVTVKGSQETDFPWTGES